MVAGRRPSQGCQFLISFIHSSSSICSLCLGRLLGLAGALPPEGQSRPPLRLASAADLGTALHLLQSTFNVTQQDHLAFQVVPDA